MEGCCRRTLHLDHSLRSPRGSFRVRRSDAPGNAGGEYCGPRTSRQGWAWPWRTVGTRRRPTRTRGPTHSRPTPTDSDRPRAFNAARSSRHCSVKRTVVVGDRPAELPGNGSSAARSRRRMSRAGTAAAATQLTSAHGSLLTVRHRWQTVRTGHVPGLAGVRARSSPWAVHASRLPRGRRVRSGRDAPVDGHLLPHTLDLAR